MPAMRRIRSSMRPTYGARSLKSATVLDVLRLGTGSLRRHPAGLQEPRRFRFEGETQQYRTQ
jgi:hypothetical protein